MPNKIKHLTSQAHAASQVNVKPTKKAKTYSRSGFATTHDDPKEKPVSSFENIEITITDGRKEIFTVKGHLSNKNNCSFEISLLPKEFIEHITSSAFHEMNIGLTRLANSNILLTEKLSKQASPFTFHSCSQGKNIDLKSAPKGIEELYDFSEDFTRYKDALTMCILLAAKDDFYGFDKEDIFNVLYFMFEFFSDLHKDVRKD